MKRSVFEHRIQKHLNVKKCLTLRAKWYSSIFKIGVECKFEIKIDKVWNDYW